MSCRSLNLAERLLDFATLVGGVARCIPDDLVGRHVARELLRAGTAPATLHQHALDCDSSVGAGRLSRLTVRRLRDASLWLRLVSRLQLVDRPVDSIIMECEDLVLTLHEGWRQENLTQPDTSRLRRTSQGTHV